MQGKAEDYLAWLRPAHITDRSLDQNPNSSISAEPGPGAASLPVTSDEKEALSIARRRKW
jgi:hypothetical protein